LRDKYDMMIVFEKKFGGLYWGESDMKRLVGLVAVIIIPAILHLSALPGLAVELKYIEDFSRTRYKDALHTTALWDTVAAKLKLYPFVPTIVGTYNTPGTAYGVTVSGDYAFVADYGSGLQVINIKNPASPTLAGTCDTPGNARSVAVSGDYAFVADFGSGLQVINISNPAVPTLVGAYDTPGYAWGVTVSGDRAFVADDYAGLQVINIRNPASPTLVGTCNTPGAALGVAVSGDHAFVADYTYGLQVIDISNPASPTLVGTYDTPGIAYGVAVSGDHAFVADYTYGLQVIDISNPASPTLVGTYDTPGYAWGVTVSGDRAYVTDDAFGLQVIDISNLASPTLAATCDTPGSAWGVAVLGEHAFVADCTPGLQVIRISHPAAPALIGTCDTPSYARGVAVSGEYAFVADYNDYGNVMLAGTSDMPGNANGVAVSGDPAGALAFFSGLQVIDISDPASPTIVGTYDTGITLDIAVAGDHAFLAEDGWLRVIDIGDPAHPTLVGSCGSLGLTRDVVVSGDHAYVAAGFSGLKVIDISNPASPALVGTYVTPDFAVGVTVSGKYAFVAGGASGLLVIDISDPTTPTLVGTCDTPGSARGVAVSGDHAFVADWTSGLQVIDISNPASPTLAGTCDTPGYASGVTVSGDQTFVADYSSGLQVIDISDPAHPTPMGTYDTSSDAYCVAVSGDHAFVADDASGLEVIQVFQSEVNQDKNVGRSLAVNSSTDAIYKARLLTAQTNTVTWELSANGGVSWQEIAADGGWNQLTVPGSNLLWRSTHEWAAPGVNPGVTRVEIDWLYQFPVIDAITDVGNDQGRQVRIEWTRNANDFVGASPQVVEYAIYRRIDPVAAARAMEPAAPMATTTAAAIDPEIAAELAAGWDYVTTVPAEAEDQYAVVVPTLADSTIVDGQYWSVFRVRARTVTPGVYYNSYPDSGYSVDNIAPGVPTGFAIAYNTGSGNRLSWNPSPDKDFQYFRVYRSSDPNFVPSPSNLVHSTIETIWSDPDYDGWSMYYKITALDYVGNESDPASAGTVTEVAEPVIPQTYGLYPNVPNPFNPSTTIRYDMPAGGGAVTLRIYDVAGRLVRTLVDGPQAAGQKTVTWNGKDDRGRSVVSGVYFYRLEAPGYKKTLKMILVQ
jgi:hypothetical protein